jgi:hypothetical protein
VVGFYQSDYGVWMELEVEFNYVVSCEMILAFLTRFDFI